MNKTRIDKSGFSTTGILLILAVVALVGISGVILYKHQNKLFSGTVKTNTNVSDAPKVQASQSDKSSPFVNVIQNDSTIIQVSPEQIAKTTDQTDILTALQKTCTSPSNYVTVNVSVFDGGVNFNQEDNHAVINANACSNAVKTLDELKGSSSANYLHKNDSGKWQFDTKSQMAPDCKYVDGLGYASSIISSCYEGSVARAPR